MYRAHIRSYPHFLIMSFVVALCSLSPAFSQQSKVELNTALMNSTFKLVGHKRNAPDANTNVSGTGFILGLHIGDEQHLYYVLISARHVFDQLDDTVTIILRQPQPDGTFKRTPYEFKVRHDEIDFYVHHPDADVAAMYLAIPKTDVFGLVDTSVLADDTRLKEYEIHPGDELLCLGYPLLAEGNPAGFPILRSGRIASYPLLPSKLVKSFLYDFHVYEGNSGGPVYFSYDTRYFGGSVRAGPIQSVVGLVSQQETSNLPGHQGETLNLAIIIPSIFIIETLNLLPRSGPTKAQMDTFAQQ